MIEDIPQFVVKSTRSARIHHVACCDISIDMSLLPNETVGQRIRIAREYLAAERQQRVSQADLADLCGWGQTRIGNYERDIRSPDADAIQVIARVTGCRAEWIQFGTGAMHAYHEGLKAGVALERTRQSAPEPSNVLPGPPIRGMVPIISWVSAGRWREPDVALDEPLEWLPVTFKTPNVFGLRVDGDSMEPDFPPGTIIFVDPDRKAEAMNLVIALNGDDEATFKRLTKEGGVWYLTPLNPRYPLQKLDSLCKIIGVVIMASRWTV